jgi:hypothetical protein
MRPSQDTNHSAETDCPLCRGELWVCEAHPLTPFEDCCGEPGIPCRCNPTEKMITLKRVYCQLNDEP